ncbi:MAG TPA: DoxX family protein, partial [Gemmataceae bacterium]|nr:DoxX family protein [Gemmataceae bacterium]
MLNIPIQVLYAGLAGCVLALIVATAQNRWSCKVFFLLALRLAIGWHFLFEGLHKINSHYVGVAEGNRPFSSEPYFKDADGPLAPLVRARTGDIDEQLKARLEPQNLPPELEKLSPNARAALPPEKHPTGEALAKMVPAAVAEDWATFVSAFKDKYKLDAEQKKQLDTYTPSALAIYARWAVGIEGRDSTVKFVSTGKPPLTAPQRREYIEHRKHDLDLLLAESGQTLGTSRGSLEGRHAARLKETKALVSAAKAALLADADALLNDLMKQVFEGTLNVRLEKPAPSADAAVVPPSKFVEKDDKKLADLLPVGKSDAVGFDALPTDVKHLWTNFQREFKSAYPLGEGEAKKADEYAAVAKERFARWYFDKDEFTGTDKPGLSPLVKTYRDSVAKSAALKPQVDETLKGLGAAELTWFNRSAYSGVTAIGEKATADAEKARTALLSALDGKYGELRKAMTTALPADLADGKVMPPPPPKVVERMDWWTRWTLTAVGAMLLMGLFTRTACLVAAGFLVMTYLTHPPFPWLAQPPGTEGNPLFINKNVIEALALLVILVHPTGRWMGLDAIIHRCLFRNSAEYTDKPQAANPRTPLPHRSFHHGPRPDAGTEGARQEELRDHVGGPVPPRVHEEHGRRGRRRAGVGRGVLRVPVVEGKQARPLRPHRDRGRGRRPHRGPQPRVQRVRRGVRRAAVQPGPHFHRRAVRPAQRAEQDLRQADRREDREVRRLQEVARRREQARPRSGRRRHPAHPAPPDGEGLHGRRAARAVREADGAHYHAVQGHDRPREEQETAARRRAPAALQHPVRPRPRGRRFGHPRRHQAHPRALAPQQLVAVRPQEGPRREGRQ